MVEDPPEQWARSIEGWLYGDRRTPPPFDLSHSTAFEAAVLRKALELPRGQVRPYSWIAQEIGSPNASGPVGSALAGNPVPVLIPCHRVVRGDGVIGNYIFGTEVKRACSPRSVPISTGCVARSEQGISSSGATTACLLFPDLPL